MKRMHGFTLVELLVVIAIISILAAIIIPKVSDILTKGRMTKAAAEVRNIDLAVTNMLSQAKKENVYQMLEAGTAAALQAAMTTYMVDNALPVDDVGAPVDEWTRIMYELLRVGSKANVPLRQEVRDRLADAYMPLERDPWGNQYQFLPGPWPSSAPMRLRAAWAPQDANDDGVIDDTEVFLYDAGGKAAADADVPGNPPADDIYGYPADRTIRVYVWSRGANLTSDQEFVDLDGDPLPEFSGGGDDVNNWDTKAGWENFY